MARKSIRYRGKRLIRYKKGYIDPSDNAIGGRPSKIWYFKRRRKKRYHRKKRRYYKKRYHQRKESKGILDWIMDLFK